MDLTSGYPLWPVVDGLIQTYPHLDANATCDVAIIGAGVTGALVAHQLVEAGIDTIVIDKRDVGWGSTAASTALLQYEIDVSLADLTERRGAAHANRAYLACRDAIGKIERLAKKAPKSAGFERKQSLYLASHRRDRKALRTELELRRAIGIDVEWLDEAEIAKHFAFRRPAALLSRDGAQIDSYAFTHALFSDSSGHGLRLFDRTNVASVEPTKDGVLLRTADGFVVRARRIVFASGYETHSFLDHTVAKLVSTYAIASEPLPSLDGWGKDHCLIWEHATPYLYLRTTVDNRVIIGGEDEDFRNPVRRDRLLPKKAERLAERFRELFPDLDLRVAFAWTGTFGETTDGLAYIGQTPEWPHAYFALGYGGNGITYSVLAAEIIRDALLGKRNEYADLFRFDR